VHVLVFYPLLFTLVFVIQQDGFHKIGYNCSCGLDVLIFWGPTFVSVVHEYLLYVSFVQMLLAVIFFSFVKVISLL